MDRSLPRAYHSQSVAAAQIEELCCRSGLTAFTMVAGDVLSLLVAMAASLLVDRLAGHSLDARLLAQSAAIIIATILSLAAAGLYPALGTYRFLESKRLTKCVGFVQLTSICIFSFTYAAGYQVRTVAFTIFAAMTLTFGRSLIRRLMSRKLWWGESILLIGCGDLMREIAELLEVDRTIGLHIAAVSYDGGEPTHVPNLPCLPTYESTLQFARERKIKTAIVVIGMEQQLTVADANSRYAAHFPKLITVPPIPARRDSTSRAKILGGYLNIRVTEMLLMRSRRAMKRGIDIFIASLAGIVFLPLMLAVAAAVKLTSRGPVFFGHTRVIGPAKEFKAWKFRTMVSDADSYLAQRLLEDPTLRSEWERDQKLRKDPRVTPIGAVLRKYSLDELPQLWNILAKDMSLVGPRPICRDEIGKYAEYFNDYARVRPGLTGLWQVSGRNEMSYEERVQLDMYYVNNWTLWLDLYIIVQTIRVVVSSRGAY